jgi:hypothetical protein
VVEVAVAGVTPVFDEPNGFISSIVAQPETMVSAEAIAAMPKRRMY